MQDFARTCPLLKLTLAHQDAMYLLAMLSEIVIATKCFYGHTFVQVVSSIIPSTWNKTREGIMALTTCKFDGSVDNSRHPILENRLGRNLKEYFKAKGEDMAFLC